MKLNIQVNVNTKCSGYKSDRELRDNITDFVYDWFVNGADAQNVDFSIRSIKTKSKGKRGKEVYKWQC